MATNAAAAPKLPAMKSWKDVDAALAALASVEPQRDALQAALDGKIAKLKQADGGKITKLAGDAGAIREQIEKFVLARAEDFDETRTRKLDHGTVSLAKTPDALALTEGSTWEKVIAAVRKLPQQLQEKFLRVKPEVNKPALKTAITEGKLTVKQVERLGVCLSSSEKVEIEVAAKKASPNRKSR